LLLSNNFISLSARQRAISLKPKSVTFNRSVKFATPTTTYNGLPDFTSGTLPLKDADKEEELPAPPLESETRNRPKRLHYTMAAAYPMAQGDYTPGMYRKDTKMNDFFFT
jgi:hypothetical protein